MTKKELIFDGKEKQVFSTDDSDKVIFRYKDVTLAYNSIKRARFVGKGALDNQISAIVLGFLNDNGVKTHFIEQVNDREQLCWKIEIIPLEIIVRNRVCGSLATRLGIEDGYKQPDTIVDIRYNNDDLGDPLINEHHAVALGLVSYEELDGMIATARRTNDLLCGLFHKAGIELVDVKIEFGRSAQDGRIIISDEISPDTCRLWDEATGQRLDKDRFRLDLSDVVASYRTVLERLTKVMEES